ncbi:hypothetical protein [Paludibacterium paludis]|uniref:Uncharacterized protein n=1 Tax=Paludibacterium paludis TaxID=1225769 RepID=A0A918NZ04_9NEIS|nr:hypothetical protein [Paludibacterium paludis]GGY07040.1 hypothetical protein GCM10011289_07060 [Paludibacterium paludis]
MKGDVKDFVRRLATQLPPWFGDDNPVRDAVLEGLATAHAWFFSFYLYVRAQTRLLSMADSALDLFALDFFGEAFRRGAGQSDSSFRNRIRINLFRERGTRRAVEDVLLELTGRAPVVIEPARMSDCGAVGVNLALGAAGYVGSLTLPFQAFVTAFRPRGNGAAGYPGVASNPFGLGINAIVAPESVMRPSVSDADILAAINAVKPAGTLVWARISH